MFFLAPLILLPTIFCFRAMMKIKHQPVAPSGQLLCVNLTHPPLPVPPAQGEVGLGAGAAEEGVV